MSFRRSMYVLVFVWLMGLVACSSSSDGGPPTGQEARQKFLDTRGSPQMFAISFADQAHNDDGSLRTESRRIEQWIYLGDPVRIAQFDNGYFVSEVTESGSSEFNITTQLLPEDFSAGMSPGAIMSLLGTPDSDESTSLGGVTVRLLRYDASTTEPVRSFSFEDGGLLGVVVGFALVPEEQA